MRPARGRQVGVRVFGGAYLPRRQVIQSYAGQQRKSASGRWQSCFATACRWLCSRPHRMGLAAGVARQERQALPCCREATDFESTRASGSAADQPVYPVCVEQELESWLLASEHAISAYLSSKPHPYVAKQVKKPDRQAQPKAVMNNHFNTARGQRYEDRVHAVGVLKAAPVDLRRLRRSVSFARFESKLLA